MTHYLKCTFMYVFTRSHVINVNRTVSVQLPFRHREDSRPRVPADAAGHPAGEGAHHRHHRVPLRPGGDQIQVNFSSAVLMLVISSQFYRRLEAHRRSRVSAERAGHLEISSAHHRHHRISV